MHSFAVDLARCLVAGSCKDNSRRTKESSAYKDKEIVDEHSFAATTATINDNVKKPSKIKAKQRKAKAKQRKANQKQSNKMSHVTLLCFALRCFQNFDSLLNTER